VVNFAFPSKLLLSIHLGNHGRKKGVRLVGNAEVGQEALALSKFGRAKGGLILKSFYF
jgi:hypothetical protein